MATRTYESPVAFKQALEQRIRSATDSGSAFARKRQLIVFDRFLARIDAVFGDAATLKGGLVLEVRLHRARTTKDVDLRMRGNADTILGELQRAGRLDLGDFMTFEVQADRHHPGIQNEGMQYDGLRFRAACRLAAKPFGQPFGVDVAFGDPILGEPEIVTGADVLGFAGIAPTTLRLYPAETHVAEKLHAYTLPRARPNTRVKDLPDLALLGSAKAFEAGTLRRALEQTFAFRNTHPLPGAVPDPPKAWKAPYEAMAREDGLPWGTLAELASAVRKFLDPVLRNNQRAAWDPTATTWTAQHEK